MAQFILSGLAETDLYEIVEYIEAFSETQANLVYLEFLRHFSMLAENPAVGRDPDCGLDGLFLICGTGKIRNYLIYYREIESGVEIVQLVHGARQQSDALRDE